MLTIHPVPILNDNYTWIIKSNDSDSVYVVDPGEYEPVARFLTTHNWKVEALLITHSHRDHTGGIDQLLATHPAPVIGPNCSAIPQITQVVDRHSSLHLWNKLAVKVLETPGHLPEHICFYISIRDQNILFCGDIMFSSGCGKNFVGTFKEFLSSLKQLSDLPENCNAYCAHEYTLSNIKFALTIEPENENLHAKRESVEKKRASGLPSLPTTIGNELKTNPFMRCALESVKASAEHYAGRKLANESEVFGVLRKWKDVF